MCSVGVTGPLSFTELGNREQFIVYKVLRFSAETYESDHSSEDAFAVVGNWSLGKDFGACSVSSYAGCESPPYNTLDNSIPTDVNPFAVMSTPQVVKIAAYFKPFDDEGNVDSFMVQHLAAFLMAVREINNKSDGVCDDLLPHTRIAVSLLSPSGFISEEMAVAQSLSVDFGGSGKCMTLV